MAALHRAIEDLGQTDFELADGEAVVVPGRAFLGGHRPRQAMGPAVEEGRLDVGRPERIAGSLQGGRVGAREKPIVEALKANAIAAEALLHPLMAVETELHRIREIGADLEKGGPPIAVLDVEVVMIDGHRLPREVKDGCVAPAWAFVRFERSHLLLGDANDDHTFSGRESVAIFGHQSVLTLPAFKRHDRSAVTLGECVDGGGEVIVSWFEQGGRRHGVAEIVVEEVAQAA
jgi:hypothetical protein